MSFRGVTRSGFAFLKTPLAAAWDKDRSRETISGTDDGAWPGGDSGARRALAVF